MRSRMMAISLGITSVCWFPALPERSGLYGLLLSLCLLVHLFVRVTRRDGRSPVYLLVFLLLGVCWGVEYGYRLLERQLPRDYEGQLFDVEGEVIALPERNERFQRFRLRVHSVSCSERENCPQSIKQLQLNWYQIQQLLAPGQRWHLRVKLKRPHGMANPGGFDYQSWLLQQGVSAVGYVRDHKDNRLLADNHLSTGYWRWRLRQRLDQQLAGLTHSGILKALLIGDKKSIGREQWQLFAASNTTHLMVISGLHIGLVAALGFWFGRLLAALAAGAVAGDRVGAVFALAFAALYSLAAGLSLPTQRALVMVAVVMLAVFLRRQLAVGQGLALALLVCLLFDPLAPASLSFWLSFTAVMVIIYGLCGRSGNKRWLQGLQVQWLAFVGLLPLLAVFFGQVSYLSPFANTLLVPVFSIFIVPFNFLAMLSMAVAPALSQLLFSTIDRVLGWLLAYLQYLLELAPSALVKVPAVATVDLLLAVAGVVILLLPRALPLRYCGLLLLLPLLMSRPPVIKPGDMVLTVLDVGQGLSAVVQTAQHTLVYDIGPAFSDSFSAGTGVVIPYLYYRGVNRVDTLLLSHSDNDHAGNWADFLASIRVEQLMFGEALDVNPADVDTVPCQAGQRWQWDGVVFELLHPQRVGESEWSGNNLSCVVKVTAGSTVLLLVGDIERRVELQLLQARTPLAADILLAPHHGSQTSSSWPFIRQVQAAHVVFSSGYRNRFKHPAARVVSRYRLLGSHIYSTAHDGAVIFTVREGQLQAVQRYRSQLKRYWL